MEKSKEIVKRLHNINEEKDLRYNLYNKYLLISGVFAISIMFVNLINKRPFINVLTAIIVAALCFFLSYLSSKLKKYKLSRMIFLNLITFVYVPLGYLSSPGTSSAVLYVYLLIMFIIAFVAVSKLEYIYPILILFETIIMIQTERVYPDFYYKYVDEDYRLLDISINYFVVSIFIIFTVYYATKNITKYSEKLYDISILDGLTGLYNRRFFIDFIELEYKRSIREKRVFSIVSLDINNFKKINDNFGHLEGDKVLKDLSSIITLNIRNYDIAARIGGDELVIIFPDTKKEEAIMLFERLEKLFDEYLKAYKDFDISVAYGIEDIRNKDLEKLYKITDELLYEKKMNQKQKKDD